MFIAWHRVKKKKEEKKSFHLVLGFEDTTQFQFPSLLNGELVQRPQTPGGSGELTAHIISVFFFIIRLLSAALDCFSLLFKRWMLSYKKTAYIQSLHPSFLSSAATRAER